MGTFKSFMLPACRHCQRRSYDLDKICIVCEEVVPQCCQELPAIKMRSGSGVTV